MINMDDIALFYEIIVCRANGHCGRFDVAGANADIYRRLQSDLIPNEDGTSYASDYEKGYSAGRVRSYLEDAIERFGKQNPDIKSQLDGISKLLLEAYSIEEFDAVIFSLEELTRPKNK